MELNEETLSRRTALSIGRSGGCARRHVIGCLSLSDESCDESDNVRCNRVGYLLIVKIENYKRERNVFRRGSNVCAIDCSIARSILPLRYSLATFAFVK